MNSYKDTTHIKQLIKTIHNRRVFIQMHNFPDPDALGSAYGLQFLLKEYGIDAKICYDGIIDKLSTTRMIDYFHIETSIYKEIEDLCEQDAIIIVDAQKYNSNTTDLIGEEIACIDHHPVVKECAYEYQDLRITGACSSIIAQYIIEANVPLSTEVATALLYGIKSDTADFVRGVTNLDVEMYFKLFEHADQMILMKMGINQLEMSDLRGYSEAIQNIQTFGDVAFTFMEFSCPDGLIAIISDFVLALNSIEFCVVYSKRETGLKLSVRSEDLARDAGLITRRALEGIGSGGGHANMAGGYIPYKQLETYSSNAQSMIVERFLKELGKYVEEVPFSSI